MFIQFGAKRINMSLVKNYKSIDSDESHKIELTFLNDKKEFLHFFSKKEDRDKYLKYLDENLLLPDS